MNFFLFCHKILLIYGSSTIQEQNNLLAFTLKFEMYLTDPFIGKHASNLISDASLTDKPNIEAKEKKPFNQKYSDNMVILHNFHQTLLAPANVFLLADKFTNEEFNNKEKLVNERFEKMLNYVKKNIQMI